MQTYTYVSKGKFERREKPKPVLQDARDAIVRVTLASICRFFRTYLWSQFYYAIYQTGCRRCLWC